MPSYRARRLPRRQRRRGRPQATRKEDEVWIVSSIPLFFPLLFERKGLWGFYSVTWSMTEPSEDIPRQYSPVVYLEIRIDNISRELPCWFWLDIHINFLKRWVIELILICKFWIYIVSSHVQNHFFPTNSFVFVFCVGGYKGKQNVLSWFLLQQLWDKLKVLNSGARLVLPRVFLLDCSEGGAWQSQLGHSRSTPPPLLEVLDKLVSSILAVNFGEMAGKVKWKAGWNSPVPYPACRRPENIRYPEEVLERGQEEHIGQASWGMWWRMRILELAVTP